MGKVTVTLEQNGWTTRAAINVIGGCRPSIIGRDLMHELGLMLVQAPTEQRVHKIYSQTESAEQTEDHLDDWQRHFGKHFYQLFYRVGRIRNYEVQAEFFKNSVPVQQMGRRVPIIFVKLTLESRELNNQFHKTKYQMPNIDELIVSDIGQTISKRNKRDAFLTTMDLTYAYGQLPLNENTSQRCNFSLVGGCST